jgi:hypothetical protein
MAAAFGRFADFGVRRSLRHVGGGFGEDRLRASIGARVRSILNNRSVAQRLVAVIFVLATTVIVELLRSIVECKLRDFVMRDKLGCSLTASRSV